MHLLLLTLGAPLLGAVAVVLLPARKTGLIKGAALVFATTALALSLLLLRGFDPTTPALQFVEHLSSSSEPATGYTLAVDGLSLPLVVLTTLLTFVAVLASLNVQQRVKGYFAWLLLLEFAILGVFGAQNWSLFYMFWESTLIPLFFLISIWGGEERSAASMSFFLYTLAGSVFMLVALIAVHLHTPTRTFDMTEMAAARGSFSTTFQVLAFAGFFLGFAVKIPAFPLHGWLPLTYVEAPTPVSIVLSGALGKMGGYGLMRVTGLLPAGATQLLPVLVDVALINIVYGALLAFRQSDLKRMVAYSSMNHMGFVLLGIASLNTTGFVGAGMQMLTHGITTGALFLLVGVLYERTHTRNIADYGGLSRVVPVFTVLMSLALLASMGLPGLAGFVSELHAVLGGFARWRFLVVLAVAGVLITAATSLRSMGKLFFGPYNPRWAHLRDVDAREILAAAPLAALIVGLGVAPGAALDLLKITARQMTAMFP
jgi:NADH-quinone oxidoreductase subunit M